MPMIISWNFRENTKYYANTVFCTSAFSIPILEENNGDLNCNMRAITVHIVLTLLGVSTLNSTGVSDFNQSKL